MALGARELLEGTALTKESVERKIFAFKPLIDIYTKQYASHKLTTNLVDKLQKREEDFLKQNFNGISKKELKENFYNLRKSGTGLERLSEDGVRKVVFLYEHHDERATLEDNEKFLTWLKPYIYKKAEFWFQNEVNLERAILDAVNEQIMLNKELAKQGVEVEHTTRISKHSTLQSKNISDILLQDLGDATQDVIKQIIGAQGIKHYRSKKNKGKPPSISHVFDNSLDWWNITHGLTGSEALKKPRIRNRANKEMEEALVKYINSTATNPIPNLQQIVHHMIYKYNANNIFVGANANAITGFLGELQALCWLSLLLGNNFNLNNPTQINWTARNTQKGHGQFHADFTLKDFGIQVKNTTKNQVDSVEFVKASKDKGNLDSFLDKVVETNLLTKYDKELIKSLYATYYFNVPYNIHNKIAMEGSNSDYNITYARLESLVKIADKLLNLLGYNYLYIGVGDATKNEKGNVVFLLGGEDLIFASEIIIDILNRIDDEANRNLTITRRIISSYNIVNFINDNPDYNDEDNKHSIFKNTAYGLDLQNTQNNYLTENIKSNIVMTAAYDFTELIRNNRLSLGS